MALATGENGPVANPSNAQYADGDLLSFVAGYLMAKKDNEGQWGKSPEGENRRPKGIHVGDDGITFGDGSNQTVAAGGLDAEAFLVPEAGSAPAGVYHVGMVGNGTITNLIPPANRAYMTPVVLNAGTVISDLGFRVQLPAVGNARVAIYSNKGNRDPYPNALLANTGAISTNAAGIQTAAVNYTILATGLYWMVVNADGAPAATIGGVSKSTTMQASVMGIQTSFSAYAGMYGTVTYAAAWPDPFAATGVTNSASNQVLACFQTSHL